MDFQKSLQEKLGEHEPTEVDELILDDLYTDIESFSTDHKKTLELYNNLVHLSLNALGLKSLKNFPKIPNLQILEIRQNKLNGSDFGDLKTLYPTLYKLKIGENPIKTLDPLKVFTSMDSLKKLELIGSDVTQQDSYRDDLFKLLKNVEIIDKMNREGDEIDSTIYDEEEGGELEDDEDIGDLEGEEDEDELDEEEDDEFDDEDDEEEDDKPKKGGNKKQRKE